MRATASTAEGRVTALKTAKAQRRRSKNQEMPSPTRRSDCEERGAEKGAILAKINVPANAEVGLVPATTGAACGDGKEEWGSNSGASFYMSNTQAGRTTYKEGVCGDDC